MVIPAHAAQRNVTCNAGDGMHLDLLIPTLRRPHLLRAALDSVARSQPPRALSVAVVVINNDADAVPSLAAALSAGPYPVRVLHEPQPGKSAALNAGIAASTADYIGFIDDDEEVAADWFQVAERALETGKYDFIGGRSVLRPIENAPGWLPPGYPSVLGAANSGADEAPYGPEFPGMLVGGNAVISRATLERVGPYSTHLGPRADCRLFSCEDEEMYWRLIDSGARGQYFPTLVVYHHVHPERLRKSYYRAWCFWNGASKGLLSRQYPAMRPQLAGAPRYVYGHAIRGLLACVRATVSGGPRAERLAGELPVWRLAGHFYGRYVHRIHAPAPPLRTASKPPAGAVAHL